MPEFIPIADARARITEAQALLQSRALLCGTTNDDQALGTALDTAARMTDELEEARRCIDVIMAMIAAGAQALEPLLDVYQEARGVPPELMRGKETGDAPKGAA
jgi:hypothetical protein